MNGVIRFAFAERLCRMVEAEDSYQFRSDRPYRWLQRLCIYFLKKLKAFRKYEMEEIKTIDIDTRNFLKELKERDLIDDEIFRIRADTLLVGQKQFNEIRRLPVSEMHAIGFVVEYRTLEHTDKRNPFEGTRVRYHDLKVVVVPGMDGVIPFRSEALFNCKKAERW